MKSVQRFEVEASNRFLDQGLGVSRRTKPQQECYTECNDLGWVAPGEGPVPGGAVTMLRFADNKIDAGQTAGPPAAHASARSTARSASPQARAMSASL